MSEDEELMEEVAMRICDELKRIGYDQHKIKTRSSEIKIQEFMEHSLHFLRDANHAERREIPVDFTAIYSTGSHTEGVSMSGSDRDIMAVLKDVNIIFQSDKIEDMNIPKTNTVLQIDQNGARPCYTKLKLLRQGLPNVSERQGMRILPQHFILDSKTGERYLSSELFAKSATHSLAECQTTSTVHETNSFHVHGPSASFDNTVGDVKFDVDVAYCLQCYNLLPEVILRQYQKNVLDFNNLFKKYRCHLVPVGDKASPTASLEWRVSYALIEREIVWNFNDVQVYCYVLLKAVLKDHIQDIAEDELSSYAVKTCIFWLAEREKPIFWEVKNLFSCLQVCLQYLFEAVKGVCLPHYIVPSNNILLTKFQDKNIHTEILRRLESVMQWRWTDYLTLKPLRNLHRKWTECKGNVHDFLRVSRCPNIKSLFYRDLVVFRTVQSLYININDFSKNRAYYEHLHAILDEPPADVNNDICKFLQNAVSSRLQFTKAKGTEGIRTDVCNALLREAIVLSTSGKHGEAVSVLDKVLAAYAPHVIYIGLCGPEEVGQMEIVEYLCYVTSAGNMTLPQKIQHCLALDIVFCKKDVVPSFLLSIIHLWDEENVPLCIHPRVMTYYLLSLSLYLSGKNDEAQLTAFTLLETVRFADTKADHLYSSIAWALVGHAMFLMKKAKCSRRAFGMSLKRKFSRNPVIYFMHC